MTVETIRSKANDENLQSVKAISEYLYNTFVDSRATDEQRRQVKERLSAVNVSGMRLQASSGSQYTLFRMMYLFLEVAA
jgi:hypothetical protein